MYSSLLFSKRSLSCFLYGKKSWYEFFKIFQKIAKLSGRIKMKNLERSKTALELEEVAGLNILPKLQIIIRKVILSHFYLLPLTGIERWLLLVLRTDYWPITLNIQVVAGHWFGSDYLVNYQNLVKILCFITHTVNTVLCNIDLPSRYLGMFWKSGEIFNWSTMWARK